METKSMNVNEYVAPVVELLEVEVEVGFAGSDEKDPNGGVDPGLDPIG